MAATTNWGLILCILFAFEVDFLFSFRDRNSSETFEQKGLALNKILNKTFLRIKILFSKCMLSRRVEGCIS